MTDQKPLNSPLERLSFERFKARTMPISYYRDVTDNPTEIVKNNPNRVSLIIQNIGTSDVAISFTPDVTFVNSIRLHAGGGAVSTDFNTDGEAVGFDIWAVCASGQSTKLRIYSVIIL